MKLLSLAAVLVLASCGGKVTTGTADASMDAGGTSDASVTDGAPDDHCIQLLKELEPLRTAARTCCFTCNALQCDVSAEDVCCPISVTGKRLAAAKFIEAVQAFKAECHPMCPASPCPLVPSMNCSAQSMLCQP